MGIIWRNIKGLNYYCINYRSHYGTVKTHIIIIIVIYLVSLQFCQISAPYVLQQQQQHQQSPARNNQDHVWWTTITTKKTKNSTTLFTRIPHALPILSTPNLISTTSSSSYILRWPSHSHTNITSKHHSISRESASERKNRFVRKRALLRNFSLRRHVRHASANPDDSHHWQQLTNIRNIQPVDALTQNVNFRNSNPISVKFVSPFSATSGPAILDLPSPTKKHIIRTTVVESHEHERIWNAIPTISATAAAKSSPTKPIFALHVPQPSVIVLRNDQILPVHWGSSGSRVTPIASTTSTNPVTWSGQPTQQTMLSTMMAFRFQPPSSSSPTTEQTISRTSPGPIRLQINTNDTTAQALLSTAPASIWYKPTINNFNTAAGSTKIATSTPTPVPITKKPPETNGGIRIKIWTYANDKLKLHGEKQIPSGMLKEFNNGEIINLEQIPTSFKQIISSVIKDEEHSLESESEALLKRQGEVDGVNSHHWHKLPTLSPGSASSSANGWPNPKRPPHLNYVVWKPSTTPRPDPLQGFVKRPGSDEQQQNEPCDRYVKYLEQYIQKYLAPTPSSTTTATTPASTQEFPLSPLQGGDSWTLLHEYLNKQMTPKPPSLLGASQGSAEANVLGNVGALQWILHQMNNRDIPLSPTTIRPGFSSPSDINKLRPPHRDPFWAYLNPIYQHLLNKFNRNRLPTQVPFLDNLALGTSLLNNADTQLGLTSLEALGTSLQHSNFGNMGQLPLTPQQLAIAANLLMANNNGINHFPQSPAAQFPYRNDLFNSLLASPTTTSVASFTESYLNDENSDSYGLNYNSKFKSQLSKKKGKKSKGKKSKKKKGKWSLFDPSHFNFDFKFGFDVYELLKQKFLGLMALNAFTILTPLAILALATIIPFTLMTLGPLLSGIKLVRILRMLKRRWQNFNPYKYFAEQNQHDYSAPPQTAPFYDYHSGDGGHELGWSPPPTPGLPGHEIHHHFYDYAGPSPGPWDTGFANEYPSNPTSSNKLGRVKNGYPVNPLATAASSIVSSELTPHPIYNSPEVDTQYNRQVMEILMNNKNSTINTLLDKWNLGKSSEYIPEDQLPSPRVAGSRGNSSSTSSTFGASHKFRRRKNV